MKKKNSVISMRMSAEQDWEDAVEEVLSLRLGIAADAQHDLLEVDNVSHRITEEIGYSRTYPGLKTVYVVNEIKVRVKNPRDRHWHFIGLPGGTDFTFVRQEVLAKTGEQDLVITQWGWQLSSEVEPSHDVKVQKGPSYLDDRQVPPETKIVANGSGDTEKDEKAKRRVDPPEVLLVHETDELLLSKLMLGRQTDWIKARRAAARICDPDYTTKDYYDDVSHAFPELRLYCIARSAVERQDKPAAAPANGPSATTTARTADDEYQRTIGALFCVFWLMRLHLDGRECFCYGLNKEWQARTSWDHTNPDVEAEFKKRSTFLEKTDWDCLEKVLIGAGLLKARGQHDPERTLAFLVLMTIHDIMKLDVLLPAVGRGLQEFCGYKRGETIMDHDIALSYVLENCPMALPSFAGLSKPQQDSIRFTHCKLEYNMGWLVQAEAPPSALFRAFRKVVISGNFSTADIAFYFVHWFADLAGAEPYPMQGCEKFVLKFPQKVLGNFVDSFPVVWHLGENKTETNVFEDYLAWRWENHEPNLGPPPEGKGSIAKMRLVLMAQGDSPELLKQFQKLPDEEKQILSDELAMTGNQDQTFQRDPSEGKYAKKGPALLIYYSPALMQKSGRKDPRGAMILLAEVFRQARVLWPLSDDPETTNKSVIVRIDAIKDLQVTEIQGPEVGNNFVLVKNSSVDGQVRLIPVSTFHRVDWSVHQILEFGPGQRKRRGMFKTRTWAAGSMRKVFSNRSKESPSNPST
jgi:hypothetical protein